MQIEITESARASKVFKKMCFTGGVKSTADPPILESSVAGNRLVIKVRPTDFIKISLRQGGHFSC